MLLWLKFLDLWFEVFDLFIFLCQLRVFFLGIGLNNQISLSIFWRRCINGIRLLFNFFLQRRRFGSLLWHFLQRLYLNLIWYMVTELDRRGRIFFIIVEVKLVFRCLFNYNWMLFNYDFLLRRLWFHLYACFLFWRLWLKHPIILFL